MSDYFADLERELRAAVVRRAHMPWYRRRPFRSPVGSRVAVIAVGFVFATTAITLAGTGVILTGSSVRPSAKPVPTAGEGVPVRGGSRLLGIRAADPAGGLPWGMRVVHTTRGLVCVQLGRVENGRLGQLGIDGAFGNDGRFHPLPTDALPDVLGNFSGFSFENCAEPGATYSGDVVGLQLSGAGNPRQGEGPPADRREISFGLLGKHARTITYRSGTELVTKPVLRGLGAYLIVQPYTSGRQLGSVSESDGHDGAGNYSQPTAPNGALTTIVYSYAGRRCVDRANGVHDAACGLSEVPPPKPAALPVVHVPLKVHLHVRGHVVTSAELRFPAPYPVTSAAQDYSIFARTCRGLGGSSSQADVARGETVRIDIEDLLAGAQRCTRALKIKVEYVRTSEALPQPTRIGTVTVREPPGTHAVIARPPR
jgi:hypothetical protein